MNRYLAQANGYPGTNFGGSCFAENFTAPGYNGVNDPALNDLQSKCPSMVSGIPRCQSLGKKILLSLGGQAVTYALTSVEDAEYMADFLWGAFGPLNPSGNWPRPFDTEGVVNEVDGFDFDIEHVNTGKKNIHGCSRMLTNTMCQANKSIILF
jgi:chitinase